MSPALVQGRAEASKRGVRLTEWLHRLLNGRMIPTPNAGNDHWGGRLDELGGSTNPFRGTELGRLRINPCWYEELMGWPIDWTALQPLETAKFQSWLRAHGSACRESSEPHSEDESRLRVYDELGPGH